MQLHLQVTLASKELLQSENFLNQIQSKSTKCNDATDVVIGKLLENEHQNDTIITTKAKSWANDSCKSQLCLFFHHVCKNWLLVVQTQYRGDIHYSPKTGTHRRNIRSKDPIEKTMDVAKATIFANFGLLLDKNCYVLICTGLVSWVGREWEKVHLDSPDDRLG